MRSQKLDFFVSIIVVIVMIVLRPISIYHWVDAYPSEMLEIDPETDSIYMPPWRIVDVLDKKAENVVIRFEESIEGLQKIFGIRSQSDKKSTRRQKIPPQFMMELYNTIADSSGVTHGKNPYNAKVVRSFIERETLYSHAYLFDVSGLEINESVLEAELHLYRERTSLERIHPTILSKPGYLIKVYQVVEGKSLVEPDLHKLLNVRYVEAHAFGWQVFNVKQAVVAWISGAPNLGLLVTASNLFNEQVIVEFSRRNEYNNGKQPILVLFNDDGKESIRKSNKMTPHYYTYDNDSEELEAATSDEVDGAAKNSQRQRQDRESSAEPSNTVNPSNLNKEYSYGTQLGKENLQNDETDYFEREKKMDANKKNQEIEETQSFDDVDVFFPDLSLSVEKMIASNDRNDEREKNLQDFMRQRRGTSKRNRQEKEKKKFRKFVSKSRSRTPQMLSSMDIYERAMLRERMMKKNVKKYERREQEMDNSRGREKRSSTVTEETNNEKSKSYSNTERNTTECARHELYVDFKEIGLSSAIIAPKGYSAYHCQGMCNSPLSQDQQPTNHATVQGLVHKMGVLTDVHMPCCVPTKLLRTSILFFDDNENVVLKVYEDMIADRCGCR